ncbi:MAG TPA: hypothetical protein P5195_10190, partial [Anaerolineae bacterium]|nr:hypothetical protein [Anaerolineae bacterium]
MPKLAQFVSRQILLEMAVAALDHAEPVIGALNEEYALFRHSAERAHALSPENLTTSTTSGPPSAPVISTLLR